MDSPAGAQGRPHREVAREDPVFELEIRMCFETGMVVRLEQVVGGQIGRNPGGERAHALALGVDHLVEERFDVPGAGVGREILGGQGYSSGASAAASSWCVQGWIWLRPAFLAA